MDSKNPLGLFQQVIFSLIPLGHFSPIAAHRSLVFEINSSMPGKFLRTLLGGIIGSFRESPCSEQTLSIRIDE